MLSESIIHLRFQLKKHAMVDLMCGRPFLLTNKLFPGVTKLVLSLIMEILWKDDSRV